MKVLGIIPARYASTRLPGKPLAIIGKKSMIQRVYEQAKKSSMLNEVVVATDDQRIFDTVVGFGGQVMMTYAHHKNGTERCAEVIRKFKGYDYVINIQGDEPFINPAQIDTLAEILDGKVELGTLVKKIEDPKYLEMDSIMKVVFTKDMNALYFSRNAIPYVRDKKPKHWLEHATFYKHIGIYAYRTDILKEITSISTSNLESAESLEQLRWLENGFQIKVAITQLETFGIDTPEDLEKANESISF